MEQVHGYNLSVLPSPTLGTVLEEARNTMPRTPSEYIIHMLFDGGHHEEVRFSTIQEFQKWYSGELMPKATSEEFISVPIPKINPGEYMVIRPSRLLAIRVEPVFSSSVERF